MFFMKVLQPQMECQVFIMFLRAHLKIFSHVIKQCRDFMYHGGVVGIRMVYLLRSKLRKNWVLQINSRLKNMGLLEFNQLCRESAFSNIQEWEKLTERIAYWVDFETAYITYKNSYIESVWWILEIFGIKDFYIKDLKWFPIARVVEHRFLTMKLPWDIKRQ